jgi:hypothetical protein
MSTVRTRSGRISKQPERLEIFEEVEDDFTDDEDEDFDEDDYDSESETESEFDDDEEDADENGNLAGFVIDDDDCESEDEE